MARSSFKILTGKFRRDRSGTSAVEAAFLMPVMLAVMFGLGESARGLYSQAELAYALYKTTRYAMVYTGSQNTLIRARLNRELVFLDSAKLSNVDITETVNSDSTKTVTIAASYRFDLALPIAGVTHLTLRANQTFLRL